MKFHRPISEIIKERKSCRSFREEALNAEERNALETFLKGDSTGPFGSKARFQLVAAESGDGAVLKGLGTYGMIKKPQAFVIGAVGEGERSLEDYGYLMERIILFSTDQGLGSCWLGGTFRKSRFAARMNLSPGETVPAVAVLGYPASRTGLDSLARRVASSDRRKPWEHLFFLGNEEVPLSREAAGPYAGPLEMLRLAPSASNHQPWRIFKDKEGDIYHFHLRRSNSYTINLKIMGLADLQRVDMGIAMCHFELAAQEAGLKGGWVRREPASAGLKDLYIASWEGKQG